MNAWDTQLAFHQMRSGVVRLTFAPDEAQRAEAAAQLALVSLPALTASVTATPWLDGVELNGTFEAVVEQICGVSLEAFGSAVTGEFQVRVVPAGSPHAAQSDGGDVEFDADAPDPPDVLSADGIDVAAYVLEHLALELDPFPRKPGVTFDFQPAELETSPFAALRALTPPKA